MTPEQGAQSGVMKASFAIINKKLQANATKLHRRNHSDSATPETAKTDENNNRDNDRERNKTARETDNDATIQDRS